MRIRQTFSLLVALVGTSSFAQIQPETVELNHSKIQFIQNDGQWHKNVRYKSPLGVGAVFLENNIFTYVQYDAEQVQNIHNHDDHDHDHGHRMESAHDMKIMINGHAWRTRFEGANSNPTLSGVDKEKGYHNYFIGNDKSRWASHVPLFNIVEYDNLYDGIDMKVHSAEGIFKYDFIVEAGVDPSIIVMNNTGLDRIEIRDGNLIYVTSVGEFIEKKPYAYQIIDGTQNEVPCAYVLKDGKVSFEFAEGYNSDYELVIDPELIGATLSGSTVTNWGHCAAYDKDGYIYTGARSFGAGYPTDDGSFQTDFGGGGVDIAVSKLEPDASDLVYASYLGGSGQDIPHSIVVSDDNELYTFGTSQSIDYPVSDDAYDGVGPDGGSNTDIVVTHLTEDGSDIVGSTYIGGAAEGDGINTLTSNYGDQYRGEIITDADGNCYIASSTTSSSFPTTPGAYQETYGGGTQDGVVFSFNPALSDLRWSTYVGGASGEGALGLRLDFEDNVYFSGVCSDEFVAMPGYQDAFGGGTRDAFVMRLIDDGSTVSASSYWGTGGTDAAFFVDLDNDGNVFLYGQSTAGSEVTPDVYSNPGSQQFICSLTPDLTDLNFGTVIGAGGNDFTPIAFMVDACGYVYFSGHGNLGMITGVPVTDDALFDSGGFYLGVLTPNAEDLEFATHYTGNHVDGGTSRFDPDRGIVYQSVCISGGFATSPDAYATTSPGYDVGVFKIDFGISHVNAAANADPDATGCAPFTVDFDNTGTGITYEWDFGDGSPISTEFEPTHTFTDPGVYEVTLIAYDPDGCLTSDTTTLEIIVGDGETPDASFDYDVNCATGEVTVTYTGTPDVPVDFDMGDGSSYDDTEFTHTYTGDGTFTITLTAGDGVCADFGTFEADLTIGSPAVDIIFNEPSCYGFSDASITVDITDPTGLEVIEITDTDGTLLNEGGSNTANTLNSGWYYYSVDLGDGCALFDSLELHNPPQINVQLNVTDPQCYGDKTGFAIADTVFNWQGDWDEVVYIWAPDPPGISGLGADSIYDLTAGDYTLTINDGNGCSRVFDFTVTEPTELVFSEFGYDPAYCRLYGYQSGNGVVYGAATGGTPDYHYEWTHLETGDDWDNTTVGGLNPGTYVLEVQDENGCILRDTVRMDSVNPVAAFTMDIPQEPTDCDAVVPVDITFTNQSLYFANPNNPFADTNFYYNFSYAEGDWVISNSLEDVYTINYTQSGDYTVCLVAQNKNGCTDTLCKPLILCDDLEFTPVNIFSPNGDGNNDIFTFYERQVAVIEFRCVVVNRWGNVIREFDDISDGWDGTDAGGNPVPDGVYFYKYSGKGQTGEILEGQGNVQLVRGN